MQTVINLISPIWMKLCMKVYLWELWTLAPITWSECLYISPVAWPPQIGRFYSNFLWKIPWFGWPIPQNCEEQNIWYSLREFGIIISKQWQDQNIRRVAYKILALFIRRVGFARWNLAKKWVFLDTLFITFHTVFNSNVNLYIYPHACSLHRRKPIGGPISVVGATTLWLSWHVTYFCFFRDGSLVNMGSK